MGPSQPIPPCSSKIPTSFKFMVKRRYFSHFVACGLIVFLPATNILFNMYVLMASHKIGASTAWKYVVADRINSSLPGQMLSADQAFTV